MVCAHNNLLSKPLDLLFHRFLLYSTQHFLVLCTVTKRIFPYYLSHTPLTIYLNWKRVNVIILYYSPIYCTVCPTAWLSHTVYLCIMVIGDVLSADVLVIIFIGITQPSYAVLPIQNMHVVIYLNNWKSFNFFGSGTLLFGQCMPNLYYNCMHIGQCLLT